MTSPTPASAPTRRPHLPQPATTLNRVLMNVIDPPPLVWQDPLCPLCTQPVTESTPPAWHPRKAWACRGCGATWDAAGDVGRFDR